MDFDEPALESDNRLVTVVKPGGGRKRRIVNERQKCRGDVSCTYISLGLKTSHSTGVQCEPCGEENVYIFPTIIYIF